VATIEAINIPDICIDDDLTKVTRQMVTDYVIKSYDTVMKISRAFNMPLRTFLALNPDVNPSRLISGRTVKVYGSNFVAP